MVRVEEVADASLEKERVQGAKITEENDFSGDEEVDEYDEDDFDINESLTDRLVALKDVIPPYYRDSVASSFGSVKSLIQSAGKLGGKSLWVISSSTLLLGVPLSLCILSEQQLAEMEKGMGITESNDVLSGGVDQGFAAAPRA